MDVRIATPEEMNQVYRLTYKEYLRQGYCKSNNEERLIHNDHLDNIPETTVIIAIENGIVIGTNSLTLDGPNQLCVDIDFPEEVKQEREKCQEENKILSASWRIVTDSQSRSSFKIVLQLINETVKQIIKSNSDIILFSFHPKHEYFYHKLLGLETITSNYCKSVGNPGVLMKIDTKNLTKKWDEVCKRRNIS